MMDRFEAMSVLLAVVEAGSLVYADAELLPLKVRCFLDWTVPRLRERMAGRH